MARAARPCLLPGALYFLYSFKSTYTLQRLVRMLPARGSGIFSRPPRSQAEELAAAKNIKLPADFAAAAVEGGLRLSTLQHYISLLSGGWLTRWLASTIPAFRDRLIADRMFLFKVLAEVTIDTGVPASTVHLAVGRGPLDTDRQVTVLAERGAQIGSPVISPALPRALSLVMRFACALQHLRSPTHRHALHRVCDRG